MKIRKHLLVLPLLLALNALAVPVSDLSADDLLRLAGELRPQLKLNGVQAIYWLQAEAKTRELAREQRARHERLQMSLREDLLNARSDADHILNRFELESADTLNDGQMLRAVWGSVAKGLSEEQLGQVKDYFRATLDSPALPKSPLPSQPLPQPAAEPSRPKGGKGGHGISFGGMGGAGQN